MKWVLPDGLTAELVQIEISPGRGEGRQIAPPRNGLNITLKRHGYLLGSVPATDELLAELEGAEAWRQD